MIQIARKTTNRTSVLQQESNKGRHFFGQERSHCHNHSLDQYIIVTTCSSPDHASPSTVSVHGRALKLLEFSPVGQPNSRREVRQESCDRRIVLVRRIDLSKLKISIFTICFLFKVNAQELFKIVIL